MILHLVKILLLFEIFEIFFASYAFVSFVILSDLTLDIRVAHFPPDAHSISIPPRHR